MAIILHFRLKNETLKNAFFKLCTLPEPPPGGATPAGVVIVKGIPFAYSGGGFSQEKKKFFNVFFKHFYIIDKGYIGRRRRNFFKLVVVLAQKNTL